jgi:GNAT superfamily N-acetyltransferase
MVDSASSAANTTVRTRGLFSYSPDLVADIVSFQRETFPERDIALIEPRWRWMFEESAQRLGVSPMVWVYRAATGIVAHQGAIAVRCKVGEHILTTGWFVETMVHESHRGRAVGPMLVKKALEDLPFNLSLGQTEQMREMQRALGWVQVGPLPVAALAVRARRVLAGKGAVAVRPAAALALFLRRAAGTYVLGSVHGVDVVRDAPLGSDHDALWERVSCDLPVAVVRDASFLEWKYRTQPGQRFITLDVRRGGSLIGFVAFVMRPPDRSYKYARAIVTDMVVPPSDASAVRACTRVLHDAARREGADLISIGLNQPAIQAELSRQGYMTRAHERVMLVAPGADDHPVRRWLDQPDAWLLSTSDSDIDRPW